MLKRLCTLSILPAVAALSGCATFLDGTDQAIPVNTDPVHAICDIYKGGKLIGSTSDKTPIVYVTKSVRKLEVVCSAPGYDTKTVKVISATSGWGAVSFWAWDLAVTDWISGALNKYPEGISVALNPTPGPTAERIRQSMNDELRTRPTVRAGAQVAQDQVRPGIQVPYSLAGAEADEPFALVQDRTSAAP
ncbi:hypothetical protein [Emcibacter sp. SYSU 3D8]|uniref:hypothetical protein n=1 Tax=Emcibacter sp. SYSU 3D8 TaxID=3133969 RepID=UPI0031FF1A9B